MGEGHFVIRPVGALLGPDCDCVCLGPGAPAAGGPAPTDAGGGREEVIRLAMAHYGIASIFIAGRRAVVASFSAPSERLGGAMRALLDACTRLGDGPRAVLAVCTTDFALDGRGFELYLAAYSDWFEGPVGPAVYRAGLYAALSSLMSWSRLVEVRVRAGELDASNERHESLCAFAYDAVKSVLGLLRAPFAWPPAGAEPGPAAPAAAALASAAPASAESDSEAPPTPAAGSAT